MNRAAQNCIRAVLSFLMRLLFAASLYAQPKPPFTITISPVRATVTSGDPILVQITVKNLTKQEFDFNTIISDITGRDFIYVFDVTNAGGIAVPPKTMTPESELLVGHAVFRTLGPEGTLMDTASLERLFDLSKPGTYTIRASRAVPEDKGMAITSNTITITVSEPSK